LELKNKLVIIYLSIIPILILTGMIENTEILIRIVFLLIIAVDVYTEQLDTIFDKMKYAGYSIIVVIIELLLLTNLFFFITPPLGYFAYIVMPIILLFTPLVFVLNSYIYNKYLVKLPKDK